MDCITKLQGKERGNRVLRGTLDDSTEMILTILSSQAQEETVPSAPTSSGGMRESLKKGESTRQRSYGFRKAQPERCASWEREAAVIRNMAQWFLDAGTAWNESSTDWRTQG